MSRDKTPAPPVKTEAPATSGATPPIVETPPEVASPVAAAAPSEEELAELRELTDDALLVQIEACEEAAGAGNQEAALALPYLKAELERRTTAPSGAPSAEAPEAPAGYGFAIVVGPGTLHHNGIVFVPGDEVLLRLETIVEIAPVVRLKD